MTATVNRLPNALFDLPSTDLLNNAPLNSISNLSEEAKQLGLLMYVVSVILPVIEQATR